MTTGLARDREDASSMVTAGATLTPQRRAVAHLGNQGCCVHIHTGNLSPGTDASAVLDNTLLFVCF